MANVEQAKRAAAEEFLKRTAFLEGMSYIQQRAYELSMHNGFWESTHVAQSEDSNDAVTAFICQKLLLISSEVIEAMDVLRSGGEGNRRKALGSELADIVIRTIDLAAHFGIDIGAEILDKHEKNLTRPRKHGKRF